MAKNNVQGASFKDISIAVDVLGRYADLPYRDAVERVASERSYKVKSVYGVVNRARKDKRTLGGIAALRLDQGRSLADVAAEFKITLDAVERALAAFRNDERRKDAEADAIKEILPRGHFVKGVSKLIVGLGGSETPESTFAVFQF